MIKVKIKRKKKLFNKKKTYISVLQKLFKTISNYNFSKLFRKERN